MTSDQELRANWRKNWLSSIQEFADFECQKRTWLDPTNTNPHYSYVECISCYFDDLGLSDYREPFASYSRAIVNGWVNKQEVSAVADFHKLAHQYTCLGGNVVDSYDHQVILDDPKWLEVVAAAQIAKRRFLELIDGARERAMFDDPWSLD